MTKPTITEDNSTKFKAFRIPIWLIRKMELQAEKENRNLSNYVIKILIETHPKTK